VVGIGGWVSISLHAYGVSLRQCEAALDELHGRLDAHLPQPQLLRLLHRKDVPDFLLCPHEGLVRHEDEGEAQGQRDDADQNNEHVAQEDGVGEAEGVAEDHDLDHEQEHLDECAEDVAAGDEGEVVALELAVLVLLHFEVDLGLADLAEGLLFARVLYLLINPGLYTLLVHVAHRPAALARHHQLRTPALLLVRQEQGV